VIDKKAQTEAQAKADLEAELVARVRAVRGERPLVLRGTAKMRWEQEEFDAIEKERRKQLAGTPAEKEMAVTSSVKLVTRGVVGAVLLAVAATFLGKATDIWQL
jgi:hypothetical protein